MTIQEKELNLIDQNLYRFNLLYQLRLVESNRAILYKENEKQVLKNLLESCKDVDGNKLRLVMDNIFKRSIQSVQPKATVMTTNISNTKTTKEATTLSSKATTPTLETPKTSTAKDVTQNGDTDTAPTQNIDAKQNETYTSIIERQLYDPKMSKVSVKIKGRHRGSKPKAALLHKAVTEKKHGTIEKRVYRRIQIKRGEANNK